MILAVNIGSKGMTLATGIFTYSGLIAVLGIGLIDSGIGECNSHCSRCDDGTCLECYYGYWGPDCQHECVNCWLGGCKKHSGQCEQCKPGRYGSHCNSLCSLNCRPSKFEVVAHCKRHDGNCLDGCKVGWWGSTCQHTCNSGCKIACYQTDGACISDCRKGYYGIHCNNNCSEGCALGTCDWFNGICHGECKCGYAGQTCEDVCSNTCATACRHDVASNCLKCPQCHHGYFGKNCGLECTNCKQNSCNMSGYCIEDCTEGYHGESCNKKCPSNCKSCNRDSGVCTPHEKNSMAVWSPTTGKIESPNGEHYEDLHTNSEDHTIKRYGIIQRLILPTLALCIAQLMD